MSDDPIAPKRISAAVRALIVFIVAFDVAAFWQWMDGAFQSEFGGQVEESMHYMQGLAMSDAVAGTPKGGKNGAQFGDLFSKDPKPDSAARAPAFAAAEAGWMLLFGTSRLAVLLFMAVLAAGTAVVIFIIVHHCFGNWAAAVAALLWLSAPAVRESYEVVMPEMFNALTLTGAVLCWARFFDQGRHRDALWAGVLSGAVILAGGSPLLLTIPLLLLLIAGRRLQVLAKPATWLALSIPAGLWLWQHSPITWRADPSAIGFWLKGFASVLGPAALAFAVGGLVVRWRSARAPGSPWMAMTSLVIGVILARWIAPPGLEIRAMIPMTPALAMLAVFGAVSFAGLGLKQALPSGDQRRREILWVFLLLLVAIPRSVLNQHRKDWEGFGQIAVTLLEDLPQNVRVLVASDPRGEGMLISELAMRDRQRRISIERGSDSLAAPSGLSPRGRPLERFLEDEQLSDYLASGRIQYIVLDSSVPEPTRAAYHDQIQRVIEDNTRRFWPVFSSPITRDGEPQGHPLRIFRVIASGALPD